MTLKTTKLRDAITFALAIGVTATAGAALAQETPASGQQTTELDRIEVTGSRIRQVDTETSQPVLTIDRNDIEKQGFQSVVDILQNITATGTPPISRAQPLSSGEVVGGSFISMRNLGAQRTLVLVNGKRMGISTSGLQDISTIPVAAVERIEVLKDGASSIYGSDAIAGVINIITRSNFEGATAQAYYGQYGEGDGATTIADFVMGFTGDRGSLTIAAEYAKEEKVKATDRPYSAFPNGNWHPTLGWTPVGQYGGFAVSSAFPLPGFANGRYILREGGNPRNPADYRAQNTSTLSIADKTNTNIQTDLRTPMERRSLFVDGSFDITDAVRFRTNLAYNYRDSERQVAGYPLQAIAFGVPMSPNSYFNPLGVEIRNWWRRTWEVPRSSRSELTTYRFTGSLEGSFDVGNRYFDWDVGYLYNQNKLVQTNYGNVNLTAARAAVGPSFLNGDGVAQCGTAAAPIALNQCVPFNPFLHYGAVGPGGLTDNKALQDFLFPYTHDTADTETIVFNANLAGSLATLPAGDLGFAVGVESRKEKGEFSPDALVQSGNTTDLARFPTGGSYTVNEFYAELQIPVLADVPGAQELSFNLASRYSDYDTFGDTVNSKFGFKWKPIESLMVRGTWAEGFRAPTINDLYGGGSQSFDFFTDPCDPVFGGAAPGNAIYTRCAADIANIATFRQLGQGFVPVSAANTQTPVAFVSGSNDQLTPEFSTTKTLGVVWSPGFAEGLNLALDWWNIRIENTIIGDTANLILNDCYINGITERCAAFTRDPVLGIVNYLVRTGINAGEREVEGYDFDVAYRMNTDNLGTFGAQWNSTYTLRDDLVTTKNAVLHPNPFTGVSFGSNFRIRSNLNLTWESGPWGVSWMARYYSKMKEQCLSAASFPEECSDPGYRAPANDGTSVARAINTTGSNTFHDVQVRYNAPWNATVTLGANNVFERVGPVMYTQPSANVTYYGGFDIGRFIYMKYTQRF